MRAAIFLGATSISVAIALHGGHAFFAESTLSATGAALLGIALYAMDVQELWKK